MSTGAMPTLKLMEWFKNRPKLEIDTSATWFLLSFVYSLGLTTDGIGFDLYMSGTLPVLKIPPLNTVMALLCLVMSVVVLVEPILILS